VRPLTTLLAISGGFIAAIASASAGPLTASTILSDFDAVIYTNASTSSDIEGAAVIGGDLQAATIFNGPTGSQPTGFGALTVYGNTSGNPINIDNGGNAYVGGTKGATINFNDGGSYITAPIYTIANFETPLNMLSQSLSQLAANSALPSLTPPVNGTVFKATPGTNGIAVFDITAAQLALAQSFTVNLNGASTVVFNVSGNALFSDNDNSGTIGAGNIIWNFYNATSVNIGDAIGGTVLAPDATVTNGNQIDGALVANAWDDAGEVHYIPFTGTLPGNSVPEPATFTVVGVALAGLWSARRR
jgi:choice-of-anchor A domain-containing protein